MRNFALILKLPFLEGLISALSKLEVDPLLDPMVSSLNLRRIDSFD